MGAYRLATELAAALADEVGAPDAGEGGEGGAQSTKRHKHPWGRKHAGAKGYPKALSQRVPAAWPLPSPDATGSNNNLLRKPGLPRSRPLMPPSPMGLPPKAEETAPT